jgi:hypothetical protein
MFSDRNFFVDFESLFKIFARISGGCETVSCTFGSSVSCFSLNFRGVELLLSHYTNSITNKWWVKYLCWTRVFNCIFNRLYIIHKKISQGLTSVYLRSSLLDKERSLPDHKQRTGIISFLHV